MKTRKILFKLSYGGICVVKKKFHYQIIENGRKNFHVTLFESYDLLKLIFADAEIFRVITEISTRIVDFLLEHTSEEEFYMSQTQVGT